MTMREDVARTLVVGVDASDEAAAAFDWACRFAAPSDRIVVVRAIAQAVPALVHDLMPDCVSSASDRHVVAQVHDGRPGEVIVGTAEAEHAGLVVVGHRGDGRMSMMLGSTASYVLHHSTIPVVVVRGESGRPVRRVVVGVDVDDGIDDGEANASVRAVQWAYGIDGVERIDLVHGWFIPPITVGMFATSSVDVDALEAGAQREISRVAQLAGPAPEGVQVVERVVRNVGARALVDESRDADLVVVGSHGRGGLTGLVLGSTSAQVTAHAHTPVVVIR